jgi:hypothetical protein
MARLGERHHLQRAAAAAAEVPAGGRNPHRARFDNFGEPGARSVPLDPDAFAGEREGHEHRAILRVRDAVSAMADVGDGQGFGNSSTQGSLGRFERERAVTWDRAGEASSADVNGASTPSRRRIVTPPARAC